MNTGLHLQGISKDFFGVSALRDVTLMVAKGHILGLVGQNGAGKSTLMNIIGGVTVPSIGSLHLDGQPYAPRNPSDATRAGIAFIHQELNLFSNLSIAENIFIDGFPKQRVGPLRLIDKSSLRQRTRDLLAQVNLKFPPETLVEQLSPGERQLVEIAKALHSEANVIIFDEPTTSLTARETTLLFEIMRNLREAGKTLVYVSHILTDVLALADDIAVLRDGELVGAGDKSQFDINRMITLMVGRNIEQLYPPRSSPPTQEPALEVRQLTEYGIAKNITFSLYKGEVLGIFGLLGSGRTELARMLFGLEAFSAGEIAIHGETVQHPSPRTSLHHHLAFITEDRREEGLLMNIPIAGNLALAALPQFAATLLQIIDQQRLTAATHQIASALQVKASTIDQQAVKSLSGGNQQKVVIAKWLMTHPSIFIMDEPTRGVDIGAKVEIYTLINNLAANKGSILFISSELEELIGMCDRLLVMSQGEIVGEFARSSFDKEQILRTAFRDGVTP